MAQEFPLSLVIKAVDKASGPLRALTERLEKVNAPFKQIGKDFGRFSEAAGLSGFQKGLSGFGGALKGVASEVLSLGAKLAGMGVAAGIGLFEIVRGAVESGDKLSEMAGRVGMGADAYASLSFAMAQADVDQEQFNGAMDKLNKNMGELHSGGGSLLELLKKHAPVLADQMKHAKGAEAAFSLLTSAFEKIKDPQTRALLATTAFGRSGAQMGVAMAQGGIAIQALRVEFMRLFGSQEESAAAASDVDNAMKKTAVAFLGVRNAIGAELFPVLTKLSEFLTEFMVKNRSSIKAWAEGAAKAIQGWIDGGGFERLVAGFTKVASGIGWVVDKLGPMGTAIAAAAVMAAPLIASLVSLGGAFFSLVSSAIPPLMSAFSAIGPAISAVAATGFLPLIATVGVFIGTALSIANAGRVIYENWDALIFTFKDLGNSIKWAFIDAWNAVKGIVEKLGGAFEIFKDPLGAAFNGGKMAFNHVFGSEGAAPMLGAAAAAPQRVTQSSETRVSVDFNNMPKGTRVSQDPNSSQPIDISRGYSMVPQ